MNCIHKIILSLSLLMVFGMAGAFQAAAQEADSLQIPEGYILTDSIATVPAPRIDTTLAGKDIFEVMPSKAAGDIADVNISQSRVIMNSLENHISSNADRTIEGYRIRIFFDNRQSARTDSEAMEKKFITAHPDIPVYRSYVNPYFKVTVGDFRTRSEAMQLLRKIVSDFPTAFVVKESIRYPAVDRFAPTVTDTVKVLRPSGRQSVSL